MTSSISTLTSSCETDVICSNIVFTYFMMPTESKNLRKKQISAVKNYRMAKECIRIDLHGYYCI